ncbi:uncharacterized protein DNG_05895 [Cephalotrichum gorgonifer]|uniref:DUF1753 domain-containing protein n=1 Tax=Cephalotrichum gorgonifer TaxID=2041049 RepID=A0AAE8N0N3_9PEZI|nr:uncharacterized protein DNG_05895 [Cephalotrichum gorgonifer]
MGSYSFRVRLPRPKSLLGFIGLQTGTEFISLMLVFNKLTGVYGILAIFTGFELSLLQFTTYLYSILVLVALGILVPHIRKQSPLECLLLAWIYTVDTVINFACTTFFAVQWFMARAAESAAQPDAADVPAGTPTEVAARWRRVEHLVRVPSASMPQDTAFSIILITAVTFIRVYFALVVAAYAHQVLVRYVDHLMENDRPRAKDVNGPFAVGTDDGDGWRGWLGRAMLSVGRTYWLGYHDQEDWARTVNERLRKPSHSGTASEV